MNNKENPCVFLDLSIDGIPADRMVIELFADAAPKTAENFRALCTGDMVEGNTTGKPLHYKGTEFGRIHNGVYAEGGYVSNQNGTGGESIDGGLFADQKIIQRHSDYGVLAVFPSTKGFKFYIILHPFHHIAGGDRCIFGKVIEGIETVKKIDEMGTPKAKPSGHVKVTNCGELSDEDKKIYVMESSNEGKEKKTRKRAKPSNYSSEFYHSKRKISSPSKSSESESDSGIFSSLLAKLKEGGKIPQDIKNIVIEPSRGCIDCKRHIAYQSFRGKKEQTEKKAISLDDSSDGRVTKKQHVSTARDERRDWPSKVSEFEMEEYEIKLMVFISEFFKIREDDHVESARGKKEKIASSDESCDGRAYFSSVVPNYYLEFYHSKRKYWSSESSNSWYYSLQKNNLMESRRGKKERTWKRATRRPVDRGEIHDDTKFHGGEKKITGKRGRSSNSDSLDSGETLDDIEFDEGKKKRNGKRVRSSNLDSHRHEIASEMEFFDEGKKILLGKRAEETDSECCRHKKTYLKPSFHLYPKSSNSYSSD